MRNPYQTILENYNIRLGQIQRVMNDPHEAAKLVDEVTRLRKLTRDIPELRGVRKAGGSDVQSE